MNIICILVTRTKKFEYELLRIFWNFTCIASVCILYTVLERNVSTEINIFVYKLEFDYLFDKSTCILLMITK